MEGKAVGRWRSDRGWSRSKIERDRPELLSAILGTVWSNAGEDSACKSRRSWEIATRCLHNANPRLLGWANPALPLE